jgi:hypothetical protein
VYKRSVFCTLTALQATLSSSSKVFGDTAQLMVPLLVRTIITYSERTPASPEPKHSCTTTCRGHLHGYRPLCAEQNTELWAAARMSPSFRLIPPFQRTPLHFVFSRMHILCISAYLFILPNPSPFHALCNRIYDASSPIYHLCIPLPISHPCVHLTRIAVLLAGDVSRRRRACSTHLNHLLTQCQTLPCYPIGCELWRRRERRWRIRQFQATSFRIGRYHSDRRRQPVVCDSFLYTECISGMKVVKWFCYEKECLNRVSPTF